MQFRREREVSSNTHRLQNVELVLRACNHDEFFVTTRRVHCHYSPAGGMWRKSLTLNDLSPQLKCGLPIYPFCLMLHCQLSIRLQITHFATFMSFQFVKKNSSRASASKQHRNWTQCEDDKGSSFFRKRTWDSKFHVLMRNTFLYQCPNQLHNSH